MIRLCESPLLSMFETRGDLGGILDRIHATVGGDESFGAGGLSAFYPPVLPLASNDPLLGPASGSNV